MKKIILLVLLTIGITSCLQRTRETKIRSNYCLTINYNKKIICMDNPLDSEGKYLFIQDNYINQSYKTLVVNYMMVVDIKLNTLSTKVVLSNPIFSIEVAWNPDNLPQIEDMYYIISDSKYLKESVLLKNGSVDISSDSLSDTYTLEP